METKLNNEKIKTGKPVKWTRIFYKVGVVALILGALIRWKDRCSSLLAVRSLHWQPA
jgi:hypothetical protein